MVGIILLAGLHTSPGKQDSASQGPQPGRIAPALSK